MLEASKELPGNTDQDVTPVQQSQEDIWSPTQLKIVHQVESRDSEGSRVDIEEWDGPFNFEIEHEKALGKEAIHDEDTVLQVLTVLKTDLPAESRYIARRRRRGDIEDVTGNTGIRDIMRNPKRFVALQSINIIIQSQFFIDILKGLVSYDTGDTLMGEKLELSEPYSVVSHHLQDLKAYLEKEKENFTNTADKRVDIAKETDDKKSANQVAYSHVSLVVEFVSASVNDPIAEELARYQRGSRYCTYRMLWFHFRPGKTVYVMSDGAVDAYMVKEVDMGGCPLSSSFEYLEPCNITLWNFKFETQHLTCAPKNVTIRPFQGEKLITSLDVVPCEAWDEHDNGTLRKELEERGKKWISYLSGRYIEYHGLPSLSGGKVLEGRAYIDCASYLENPDISLINEISRMSQQMRSLDSSARSKPKVPNTKEWPQYDNIDFRTVHSLTNPNPSPQQIYLLCPRQLNGFMLSTRTWETLDVRFCQPCKLNRKPFEKLVMPDDRKLMIKALVFKYTDPHFSGGNLQQVWGADFIKNKGEGQIFLLHGGPGVGKTFTAECIADFTGRPLLALTCGDIGTEEVQMESQLRKWLRLAHKWGAVMLIDEADVFLEKRMDADLKRNSLVSVFLREIEYYQGILFLTSNRVGRFDDAFISRIHVVIHYQDFNDDDRARIWNLFFDKLEEERGETMRIAKSAKRFVLENSRMRGVKWNGREIRNAFQTAVALAEYRFITKSEFEKEKGEMAVLEEKDFEQICDMTIKFKAYLENVNDGADEQQRAVQDRTRWVE